MKSFAGMFNGVVVAFLLAAGTMISGSPIAANERVAGKLALLGVIQSSFVPTHWCSNLTIAVERDVVDHCIQTVWANHTAQKGSKFICQICQGVVEAARHAMFNEDTQGIIITVLENICSFIPLDFVNRECTIFVDKFIPAVAKILRSGMDPQAICSLAYMCNNVGIDQMLAEQAVAEVVAKLPGDFTFEDTNLDLCDSSADCTFQDKHPLSVPQVIKDTSNCSLCESFIAQLDKQLANQLTQEGIEDALINFCQMLPKSDAAQCSVIIDRYVLVIFNLFKWSPTKEICIKLNMCDASV